jgi:hypothetical protein
MTNVKRLGAAVVLTFALTLAAYADCPVPGIMEGPPSPCSAGQITPDESTPDNSTAPGIMNGPPRSEAPSVELPSLAEIALNALMLF